MSAKTAFTNVSYDLAGLLNDLKMGSIALPDIQRPFVWSNTKVRDLLDSMYRGFPVGYFLFWANAHDDRSRQIGTENKQYKNPARLIIDGQQRLTSLYAVFNNQKVLDKNYQERQIEIAFRPRDARFDVCDAAVTRDPEYIPNISVLWEPEKTAFTVINQFLSNLKERVELSPKDEQRIAQNIERLFNLKSYPFTALEIEANVDEEQVSDIFVRINSKGVKLNQSDFILTLLSVFWPEGRKELETFCRQSREVPRSDASPFNYLIMPDPGQLLRVSIAHGFGRGRLQSVYQILRGKDPETGLFDPERRDRQFDTLKEAQAQVLKLRNWHQFLNAIIGAGFRSRELISSKITLLYAYIFYLMGRERYKIEEHDLQPLISRWFFATSLTGHYTSSSETTLDGDLARFRNIRNASMFMSELNNMIASMLTNDFWEITLPDRLDNSSANNPGLFAFIAVQNILGARVLFSTKYVRDLLDPELRPNKKALDRHHLFPKKYLERLGIEDTQMTNQIANYALLEWPDNIDINDAKPSEYVPLVLKTRNINQEQWQKMCYEQALPENWQEMSYESFLPVRRKLMAAMIRKGYESLSRN